MTPRSITTKALLAGLVTLSLSFVAFVFAFPIASAYAQTASSPRMFVTWKATGDYAPIFYQGKILPSYGSKITASLEVIANGKPVDLSSQEIYWYQDEVSLGGGTGVQQMTFTPFGTPPSTLDLTVTLPQYPGGSLSQDVEIPFVDPVAVIYAPFPNDEFSTNPVTLTALPFFFDTSSTSDLSFTWAVNGQTGSNAEDPQVANISLPQGTPGGTSIDVSLSIENPVGSTAATEDESLTYQNQL